LLFIEYIYEPQVFSANLSTCSFSSMPPSCWGRKETDERQEIYIKKLKLIYKNAFQFIKFIHMLFLLQEHSLLG
jgi:hypothetical protein